MYSEALRLLDKATEQYMIDELTRENEMQALQMKEMDEQMKEMAIQMKEMVIQMKEKDALINSLLAEREGI